MRFPTIAALILFTAPAMAGPPVVVDDIYEHKVIIAVGPIPGKERQGTIDYLVSGKTEQQVDKAAEYTCSLYERYSYPLNIKQSENCVGKIRIDTTATEHNCIWYYLYACGTRRPD